jgi:L-methionine (R)-S-oxide reductase
LGTPADIRILVERYGQLAEALNDQGLLRTRLRKGALPPNEGYAAAGMSLNVEKATRYAELLRELKALFSGEPDLLANLANTTAFVKDALPRASWVGFYLTRQEDLVLGPFQGPVACTRIGPGRGVCGAAAQRREVLVVPDVHHFPGHIACDARARSEVVLPIVVGEHVVGVLDIDSHEYDAFDNDDQDFLRRVVECVAGLHWEP